jgi:hypothetical protein
MAKFEKTMADTEQRSESAIYRFRPDLSYPPDQIADARLGPYCFVVTLSRTEEMDLTRYLTECSGISVF